MTESLDIDDPATWPEHISSVVKRWAEDCSGKTAYTNDLPLPVEFESSFRRLLQGHLLKAMHYTRLLPHERLMVASQGLRVLTLGLLDERIRSALAVGAISVSEAEIFHRGHVFAVGEERYREGQVCFVLSKFLYERDPGACLPLLQSWGGEALYRSSGSVQFRERLATLGTPTRVTALIPLDDLENHKVYPALHKVFVASLLGLSDVGADVFYRSSVAAERIEAIEDVELLN